MTVNILADVVVRFISDNEHVKDKILSEELGEIEKSELILNIAAKNAMNYEDYIEFRKRIRFFPEYVTKKLTKDNEFASKIDDNYFSTPLLRPLSPTPMMGKIPSINPLPRPILDHLNKTSAFETIPKSPQSEENYCSLQ